MKNVKICMLVAILAVVYSQKSVAQMPLSLAAPSTEREIQPTENVLPIKTETWSEDHIVSLGHYYQSPQYVSMYWGSSGDIYYHKLSVTPMGSVFGLTEMGTSIVRTVLLNGYVVTDFCVEENNIYLCGYNVLTNQNFIAINDINLFFNNPTALTLTLNYINLPSDYFVTKIDYYVQGNGVRKLSVLANCDSTLASAFISYDMQFATYEIFYTGKTRLLDVVHTNNRIGVLGMAADNIFALISHDKNDFHIYQGQRFKTNSIYLTYPDPKYHMATLRKEYDHVVIGGSFDSVGRMEFSTVDLNTLAILHTQGMIDKYECRSKIMSMKFDEKDRLYCLFCNGCEEMLDIVTYLQPYDTAPYPSYTVIPMNSTLYYNLLRDITLYLHKEQFFVLGRTAQSNLYFFDRFASSEIEYCSRNRVLAMELVERPKPKDLFLYETIVYDVATIVPVQISKPTAKYVMTCQ